MEKRKSTFRQMTLTKALKAMKSAGVEIGKIAIEENGRIVIDAAAKQQMKTDLDGWLEKRNAR